MVKIPARKHIDRWIEWAQSEEASDAIKLSKRHGAGYPADHAHQCEHYALACEQPFEVVA